MNTEELLKQASEFLSHRPTPRLDAEIILAHLLHLTKEQLFCSFKSELDDNVIARYLAHVDEVAAGKSVSYITHSKEFYGREFYVDERVLVPRPETEMLVEEVIRLVGGLSPACRILDLGTGSGAIGISLGLELPEVRVVLADVSVDALEVAAMNVERHGLGSRVELVVSDLLSNFIDQEFDIIVANLPYIGEKKYRFISADVEKYEPHIALFGGEDGLQLYKKMFQQLGALKRLPHFILGEFGFAQSDDMRAMLNTFFEQSGDRIEILPDLVGIDRVFIVSF